jgi:DNA helicase II / ATP-dependent DNA helicase PcrA
MEFLADFHIHSRFSRATSKSLDFENIYIAAQMKGVSVVGTGDFTHPGWFSEIKEKLVPAEAGLFKLKMDIEKKCDKEIPAACRSTVRFILATEISNIYKKREHTRKNHNLVFVPDLYTAARLNASLDAIGNITSDGRPILGLDARDLLEIVLETSEKAFLVPAHIWTPWFSLLGSKSGFNSVEECFEDLTPHIFAVETGLSSDPEMNWRVSDLDGRTLISNSDAHSALNIGREANLLNVEMNYDSIRHALRTGNPDQFLGTIEFYPEEGKYHYDGHRKCGTCYHPSESKKRGDICPVCGKTLTLGVAYRVEALADRPAGEKPERHHPFYSLIPLAEILSEIYGVGVKTKKVNHAYQKLLNQLGAEYDILNRHPISDIDKTGIPLLAEAIDRMRQRNVIITPGFDGEYGRITLFKPEERDTLLGQKALFKKISVKETAASEKKMPFQPEKPPPVINRPAVEKKDEFSPEYINSEQMRAVEHPAGPVLVVAGPGTGKTRTLTHRIAYLMQKKGISAENILAVTFTNKAAEEMRQRLRAGIGEITRLPLVSTFHSFCLGILKELKADQAPTIIDESCQKAIIKEAVKQAKENGKKISVSPKELSELIVSAKQQFLNPQDPLESLTTKIPLGEFKTVYSIYQSLLSVEGFCDFEDLLFFVVTAFKKDPILLKRYQDRFKYIFVDEYQDLNRGQYRLIRALSPPHKDLFAIGDPDQSIYGFRGSNVEYFKKFMNDYPDATIVHLTRNYRSTKTILEASFDIIKHHRLNRSQGRIYSEIDGDKTIYLYAHASERAEATAVGLAIERLVGGTGFHSMDFDKVDAADTQSHWSFSDISVFFRTGLQGDIFSEVFDRAGIPYQMVSREKIYQVKGVLELLSLLKILGDFGGYADFEAVIGSMSTGIGQKTINTFKSWGYRNKFSLHQAFWHLKRIPVPGIPSKGQQKLFELLTWLDQMKTAVKELPIKEALRYLVKNTVIKDTLRETAGAETAYRRIIDISKTHGADKTGFFAAVTLQTDTDIYDSRAERVSLMTMHAAKGLEFPIVFIAGCEDGYIPHRRSDTDIEEERRLFYVAMTRAKNQLYLTRAKQRRIFGKKTPRTVSPFISDIEIRLRRHEKSGEKKSQKNNRKQLSLF